MSDQTNCVFCKIVAGQIPCHKLFEDEHVLAFLDVGPLSVGHTLVIPKRHYVTLDQVDAASAAAIGGVLPMLSKAVAAATGASAWNILQNNGKLAHQAVDHVHFHIIPRTHEQGLPVQWPAGKLDADAAKNLVAKITANLR